MGGTDLEFGGVPGSFLMTLGLPFAVYFINLACSKDECMPWKLPAIPTGASDYFDLDATLIFLGWFGFQLFLYILPTGTIVEGLTLSSGQKLQYRCNAFLNLLLSLLAFGVLVYWGYPVAVIYDKFLQIATTAIVFSFLLAVYLYARSFTVPEAELAHGGNSGYLIYDFFIGRELNPRVGAIDWKFFCELRPGLIGWLMLDLCFIAKACQLYGSPPLALMIVTGFHALYVADALWFEEAILTTMDIVHDGFGFMLAFGDLAWVPFLYCLQARFLLEHPQVWSRAAIVGFLALNCKTFLNNSTFVRKTMKSCVMHLKTLPTSTGKQLMISGWWGVCRHPNYLGDLLMALSWSLPCGFGHILPYFYPIYFLGLLVHRFERDDVNCRKKYGADWDKYCKAVPYKIFPYIY